MQQVCCGKNLYLALFSIISNSFNKNWNTPHIIVVFYYATNT